MNNIKKLINAKLVDIANGFNNSKLLVFEKDGKLIGIQIEGEFKLYLVEIKVVNDE